MSYLSRRILQSRCHHPAVQAGFSREEGWLTYTFQDGHKYRWNDHDMEWHSFPDGAVAPYEMWVKLNNMYKEYKVLGMWKGKLDPDEEEELGGP